MYFAILGKNKELSLKELELVHPKDLRPFSGKPLVLFDTDHEEQLSSLAWLVKWGKIWDQDLSELFEKYPEKRILGVADKQLWIDLKKKHGLKRFKEVDIFHTDREVKNKGIELIKCGEQWWVVEGYQNIRLYEVVDFDKPGRSMQTGMMPAKLAHAMINIGLSYLDEGVKRDDLLIYDPFVGTGTTGFLVNHFAYDFLGADLKLSFALKNKDWWLSTPYAHPEKVFELVEGDATLPFEIQNSLPVLENRVPLIITEGWLGPIIKQGTTLDEQKEYQRWVKNVYVQWIEKLAEVFPQRPVVVFTIPWYIGYENTIEKAIIDIAHALWFQYSSLDELYKREQHKVARKVIILTPL